MTKASSQLNFFINLAKAQATLVRKFDGHLGLHHGIGFTEFVILYHLSQAQGEKLRRIDLADKIGLTASGVTRLLAPMEKIGLVKREANAQDARVSYVALAAGGKRLLTEDAFETAEVTAKDLLPEAAIKKIDAVSELLTSL